MLGRVVLRCVLRGSGLQLSMQPMFQQLQLVTLQHTVV